MPAKIINNILLFIALVLAQAVIFNNLVLFNSAVALVFVYMIVRLSITMSTNAVMAVSFLLGLSVDIFQDTPGLNAMACTVTSFVRRPIFHMYVPRDEDFSGKNLSIASMGAPVFFKYTITMVLLYCVLYFGIESFGYFDILRLVVRIVASTLFTFIVIYSIDSLTTRRSEKRL